MAEDRKQTLPCPKIVHGQQRLTREQEAYLCQFVHEWLAVLLSTVAIDEIEAEEHLSQVYRMAALEPAQMRWFDSPVAFLLAHFSPDVWERAGENVEAKVWRLLGGMGDGAEESQVENVLSSIESSIEESLMENVLSSIQSSIQSSAQACNSMWNSTWISMWNSVRENLGSGREESLWNSVTQSIGESVEAYRYVELPLMCCQFLHKVFQKNSAIHLALFNHMIPPPGRRFGRKEAWLVRKPVSLAFDGQGRLHCADGMCLQYRDGWGFYAWHGCCVPEKLIMSPESLTKEDWLQERNLEIRRAIQERLGSEGFVEMVGGACIDRGTRGSLIEVDLSDDPEGVAHYVQVQDASTERQYYLRVPPSIRRADEAVAWTFGLSEQEYKPVRET
jgi:hypothetical protein